MKTKDKKPWIETIRRASGLVEHICEHGVGHPAIGSVMWMNQVGVAGSRGTYGIHGCDGCCGAAEWRIADAEEGLRIATEHMTAFRKKYLDAGAGAVTTATSSHGEIKFNPMTGIVTAIDGLNPSFGSPPVVMNIWEWQEYYPGEDIPEFIDILDIGFITAAGEYCAPENEWREDVRRRTP